MQQPSLASHWFYATKLGFQWHRNRPFCTPFLVHSVCVLFFLYHLYAPCFEASISTCRATLQSLWSCSVRMRSVGVKIQRERKSQDDCLWYCHHILILAYIVGLTLKKVPCLICIAITSLRKMFFIADTWRQSFYEITMHAMVTDCKIIKSYLPAMFFVTVNVSVATKAIHYGSCW